MSDVFDYDAPDEIGGGGKFLTVPGTYHFQVKQVMNGQGPGGNAVSGFTASLVVLTGTDESQKDHEINLTFFNGRLTDKDQGNFARVKQGAFFIAANVMTPEQLGQRGLKIDLGKANGAQVIATLEVDEHQSKDGKTFLRLSYANIFHIDDPRASGFPKLAGAIELIPQEYRRQESFFEPLLQKKQKAASATPVAAGLSQSQLDSL